MRDVTADVTSDKRRSSRQFAISNSKEKRQIQPLDEEDAAVRGARERSSWFSIHAAGGLIQLTDHGG